MQQCREDISPVPLIQPHYGFGDARTMPIFVKSPNSWVLHQTRLHASSKIVRFGIHFRLEMLENFLVSTRNKLPVPMGVTQQIEFSFLISRIVQKAMAPQNVHFDQMIHHDMLQQVNLSFSEAAINFG